MPSPALVEGLARDILDISLAPSELAQANAQGKDVSQDRFPAGTKNISGTVGGQETDVSSIYFSDKIMITISQAGRLSQWIQVPLSSASQTAFDTKLPTGESDSMGEAKIVPKTLLGAGGDERETFGQLVSSQIASLVLKRDPEETRTVVVGLGLLKVDLDRNAWFDLLEMIAKAL